MININVEQIRVAIPRNGLAESARETLARAGFPKRPFRETLGFDNFVCAIGEAEPNDPRIAKVVKTLTFDPARIITLMSKGKVDFGIVPVDVLPNPATPRVERLKRVDLWDPKNAIRVAAELIGYKTFDREIMEAVGLRDVSDFTDRFVIKLLRACDETTQATSAAAERKAREDAWRTQEDFEGSSSLWRYY